jgi:hypothetical protein
MLVEVPAPPWNTSRRNSSWSFPAISSSQALSMPVEDLLGELAALVVGAGRRQLHHARGLDEVRIQAQLDARDVEVLESARGLDAVVGVGWNFLVAQQVVLDAAG